MACTARRRKLRARSMRKPGYLGDTVGRLLLRFALDLYCLLFASVTVGETRRVSAMVQHFQRSAGRRALTKCPPGQKAQHARLLGYPEFSIPSACQTTPSPR
jgi:hypothetical protein